MTDAQFAEHKALLEALTEKATTLETRVVWSNTVALACFSALIVLVFFVIVGALRRGH